MVVDHRLPFGKHKGLALPDVGTSYLIWLAGNVKLSSGLRQAVATELESRGISSPAPPALKPEPRCHRCGSDELLYRWHEFRNGARTVRRSCGHCGTWMGHAPKVQPFTDMADAAASDTPLLDVLTRLDELGIELGSDGAAVHFIGDGWKRCPADLADLVRQCNHTLARMLGRGATT